MVVIGFQWLDVSTGQVSITTVVLFGLCKPASYTQLVFGLNLYRIVIGPTGFLSGR